MTIEGVATTRAVSIEREVFPALIESRVPVYGYVAEAYWMDLGTPEKYLRASFDALEGRIKGLAYPAPFIGRDAGIDLRAHLGRWVVAGPNVAVDRDAEVQDSVEDLRTTGIANGKPGVLIIMFRQPGANIIATVDRVLALLPQLRASIPGAIDLSVMIDRTTAIRTSIADVDEIPPFKFPYAARVAGNVLVRCRGVFRGIFGGRRDRD